MATLWKEPPLSKLTWPDVETIVKNESKSTCIYISYYEQIVYLWVLKANKEIRLRKINVNKCLNTTSTRNVADVLSSDNFRKLDFFAEEECEDRSWFPSHVIHPARESSQASRLVEEEEDENQQFDPTTRADCYKMIIAPVLDDLVGETEIIIVPDRSLFQVPFAALEDEHGKYLSETFRIRLVPSLTTLKLIHDSPTAYHSQAGALVVGDPDVGQVLYRGRQEKPKPLPCAREEAEMIGKKLKVQPLIAQQATKQAVLERIHSASLIHFAAHGNAERGEILLAPLRSSSNEIPKEENYLLKVPEIANIRLQAKLVVLSCCHSARGQIRAEGVVGIGRAFLGSGARSVLMALWAIDDRATKEFMSRFYQHLSEGEGASESLHQTMKWMRSNGFSDIERWAPFVLMGDNVTLDLEN